MNPELQRSCPGLRATPSLLVSVRSVPEAAAALAGGAALIDIKEPAHGSLGRADDATIAEVARFVADRRPVSAALGELADGTIPPAVEGLSLAKWGLAGCGRFPNWQDLLTAAGSALHKAIPSCRPVAVAYADWERAAAPPPTEVCAFACEQRWAAFLVDTWQKDGTSLLDWLSVAEIARLCRRCQEARVRVALAGSLGPPQMMTLHPISPDWFAVRGAVCRGGQREQTVEAAAVRRLVDLLREGLPPASAAG